MQGILVDALSVQIKGMQAISQLLQERLAQVSHATPDQVNCGNCSDSNVD